MNPQDRTYEQLLSDLRNSETEVRELRKSLDYSLEITENAIMDRNLYAEMAKGLPSGIYLLRVFHDASLIHERWSNSRTAPYVIEFANDRFFKILNLNRLDFEKNPGILYDLIYESDKEEFAKRNVEANLNVTPFIWDCRFMINDNLVWTHFESVPRILENGDIIWTGTLHDISKRKRAELEIVAKNQELEILNAVKVKFLSIIAHDLRSPFNSIIGFSEFLLKKIKEKDYEKIEKYANIILHSSSRALNLLTNLLDWAKMQTGRMEFHPEYFEIAAFISETTNIYDDIAFQKSISVKKDLPNSIMVFADKAMISTVLRNLLSNAVKFTKPAGEIIISVIENQNEIVFKIKDTGVGIPENVIEKLFRVDQSYATLGTNKETGTGLGLILCKEFIEKHNGKIWVDSIVDTGSTFCFSLPLNAEPSV